MRKKPVKTKKKKKSHIIRSCNDCYIIVPRCRTLDIIMNVIIICFKANEPWRVKETPYENYNKMTNSETDACSKVNDARVQMPIFNSFAPTLVVVRYSGVYASPERLKLA